ncbi:MAG: NYN domain-containing protein [Pirellulales bacterium]|nr:NYN domain-containing protein [Pirellulales bacterium]
MPLLIDGYNLLNAVGIIDRGLGPGSLQRSRLALLNFLVESLPPDELPQTTVVFDAHDPPPGLPRKVNHRGLAVRFASQHQDADALIEQLIRAHSSPRRLTVVSSDHRLQRAARRRRATAVDSDVWYAEIVRARRERLQSQPPAPARPPVPLLEEDVNYWIRQFGGESVLAKFLQQELAELAGQSSAGEGSSSAEPSGTEPTDRQAADEKPLPDDVLNPFPPGYGEDLLEGEDW